MLDLSTLNKQQLEAVTHGEGAMLVCAGPGSGKTKVITTRISYLIEHLKIEPQHILVLTFTKQAALSMQERFLHQYQNSNRSYTPVQFGTFHAIFYQIMKQSNNMRAEAMLTDSEKRQLLLPILTNLKRNDDSMDPYQDAPQILGAINLYKNTGNLERVSHSLEEPYQSLFPQILRNYENARKRTNKYDFDDMVYQCYQLLKSNKQLLQRWQNQFRHILVDEFQDINPMQYKVLQLLTLHNSNIFVVGDDDQSIYGFRGSSPFLMQQFQRDYPEVNQVLLNTNYRSSKEIVTMSLKVIDENKTRIIKDLKAHKEVSISQEEATKLLGFSTIDNQYQYVINRLKEELQQNQLQDCAVLFRTNTQMQSFANILVKENIPYIMKEKASCIYDHFIAKDIYHYIQFASGRYERNLFLQIMNKPLRGISRVSLLEEKIDFPKIIKYYQSYFPVKEATSMIMAITRMERELNQLKAMKPYLGVTFLRKGIGYERYIKEKAGNRPKILLEWLDLLDWITADAKKYSTYEDWFIVQEYVRQQMQYPPNKEQKDKKEGVRLMTVHMSKGLEFKKVFIPDINQGIYPYGKMQEMEVVEEERRILYVAMTRAKEVLEMLYVTGNKEHPRIPSQFLTPLL